MGYIQSNFAAFLQLCDLETVGRHPQTGGEFLLSAGSFPFSLLLDSGDVSRFYLSLPGGKRFISHACECVCKHAGGLENTCMCIILLSILLLQVANVDAKSPHQEPINCSWPGDPPEITVMKLVVDNSPL